MQSNYILNNLDESQKEEKFVLDKLFKRNPSAGGLLLRRAYSGLHLRYAEAYLVNSGKETFKRKNLKSLKDFMLNLK